MSTVSDAVRQPLKVGGVIVFNLLKPNDIYIYIYTYIYMSYRSANSRRYILNIYSTNIRTEYFEHAA